MTEPRKILFEGEIGSHPVPRLLNYFYDQLATGRLVLVQEGVNKTIHIIEGKPANVESSLRDETLGRYLVKLEKITEEGYRQSLELMMSEGIQQGAALVKMGLLGPKELYKAVKDQSLQKLLTAFSFQEGDYRFYSEVEFIERIYRFEFPFHLALKLGVYQYFSDECLNRELRKVGDAPIMTASGFKHRLELFELDAEEKEFAALIDGGKNLAELINFESSYPFARKLLYLFLLCGLAGPYGRLADTIRVLAAEEKTEARVEAIIASSDSPEIEEETEVTIKQSSDKILEFYIQLKGKNYFEILGVNEDADDKAVEQAYHAKLDEFSRDTFMKQMDAELEAKLEEINTDIIKAYETLRNEKRRAGYIARLQQKAEAKKPAESLRAESFLQAGIKYVRSRDYANAQKAFEKAVELSPNEPEYYGYLGWTIFCNPELDTEEKIEQAKEKILQAIKMNPNQDSTHVFLGKILKEEGDEEGAVREFKLAVKSNPNCREAIRELEARGIEE
jgi:Flp pilus assembly protein TadD